MIAPTCGAAPTENPSERAAAYHSRAFPDQATLRREDTYQVHQPHGNCPRVPPDCGGVTAASATAGGSGGGGGGSGGGGGGGTIGWTPSLTTKEATREACGWPILRWVAVAGWVARGAQALLNDRGKVS